MESPIVSELFKLDKRIRYAQIVSSDGQILEGGMREGLQSLDPPEERAKRIQQFRAKRELVNEWPDKYGKYSYNLIVRPGVLSVPLFTDQRDKLRLQLLLGHCSRPIFWGNRVLLCNQVV